MAKTDILNLKRTLNACFDFIQCFTFRVFPLIKTMQQQFSSLFLLLLAATSYLNWEGLWQPGRVVFVLPLPRPTPHRSELACCMMKTNETWFLPMHVWNIQQISLCLSNLFIFNCNTLSKSIKRV